MDKLKDFFGKKKGDLSFKRAGPGYRLNADSSSQQQKHQASNTVVGRILGTGQPVQQSTQPPRRQAGPDENVAKATLARFDQSNSTTSNKTTLHDIMIQEKEKFEKELKLKEAIEEKRRQEQEDQAQLKQLENPYKEFEESQRFTCKTLQINDPLSFKDLVRKIKSSIYDNFTDDPVLRSAMIIFNCNRNIDGVNVPDNRLKTCLDILLKIITNILEAENDEQLEKYKRVRRSKIEQKVLSLDGTLDFLFAINFTIDDKDCDWLVYVDDDNKNVDGRKAKMTFLKDLIANPEIIPIELDRQIRVINPQQESIIDDDDDLKMTTSDLKKFHSNLEKQREIEQMFISKETKAKLLNQQSNKYRRSIFTKLRFKFELIIGVGEWQIIEAIFYSNETLADVKKWFIENFGDLITNNKNIEFKQGLSLLQQYDETLETLKLSPASTLLVIIV